MPSMSVYIGELGEDTQKEDLEREFGRFGNMTKVWVARNPPGFAFIGFENDDDADEAIKEMNGATINGYEIRVDAALGGSRRGQGCGRGDDWGNWSPCSGTCDSEQTWHADTGQKMTRLCNVGRCIVASAMAEEVVVSEEAVTAALTVASDAVVAVEDMTQDLDIAAGCLLVRGMTGGKRYPPVGQTSAATFSPLL